MPLKNPRFRLAGTQEHLVAAGPRSALLAAFAAAITNLRAGDRWRTQVAGVRELNENVTGQAHTRAGDRAHHHYPPRRLPPCAAPEQDGAHDP